MKLNKKKILASKTLGVGKNRIKFNLERLKDVNEAITKQDIRDLVENGAIFIKEIKGKKKKEERKTRRRAGSVRKKVVNKKRKYIILTRKLRTYVGELKKQGNISKEQYLQLRKEIRGSAFKSKSHLKEKMAKTKQNGKNT